MKKTFFSLASFALMAVFGAVLFAGTSAPAHAAGIESSDLLAATSDFLKPEDKPQGAVEDPDPRESIMRIVNYFLGFLGLIAVIMVIYAGFLMLVAGGEEEDVTKAKKILIWGAVGIIVVLLSYSIVQWVLDAASG